MEYSLLAVDMNFLKPDLFAHWDNDWTQRFRNWFATLVQDKKQEHNRALSLGDYFVDRWEKARALGFGEGTSVYDNVLILGDVTVGTHTWIGPNVVLDGSGGLSIGSHCAISAGVQIYSHDSIAWATSGGEAPYAYAPTIIEDRCFLGPNVVIQKGIRIGQGCVIGANSFVNRDLPAGTKAWGNPARIQ